MKKNIAITMGQHSRKAIALITAIGISLCAAVPAVGDTITYWGELPGFFYNNYDCPGLSAQAVFELNAGVLTVTLTNTSECVVRKRYEILTGLFFNVAGELTAESAMLSDGSFVWGPAPASPPPDYALGNVGYEWAYDSDLGVSSCGYEDGYGGNLFTEFERFDTDADLDSPADPNGENYGIVPIIGGLAGVVTDHPIGDSLPLIAGGVVFTFRVSEPENFSLQDISNVSFQYGSTLDDPSIPVPEPSTASLLLLGVFGWVVDRAWKSV